jgi:hypothetical protein
MVLHQSASSDPAPWSIQPLEKVAPTATLPNQRPHFQMKPSSPLPRIADRMSTPPQVNQASYIHTLWHAAGRVQVSLRFLCATLCAPVCADVQLHLVSISIIVVTPQSPHSVKPQLGPGSSSGCSSSSMTHLNATMQSTWIPLKLRGSPETLGKGRG